MTRTTAFADWHVQPRPGTDAALALGMMKVIVDRGLHDEAFLRTHTVGWEKLLADKLPEYTLERVEQITGVAAADVEKLALLYAGTKKSFIRANWGIQRHDNGGSMMRAITVLPAITGAMTGGAGICVSTGAETRGVDLAKLQRPDLLKGRTPRTINMIQLGRALNDTALAPPIKAFFCWNSDPANCVPDTQSARKGLMRDDLFVVVHDTFFSDTCSYADIVLPADTQLEHADLHGAYGNYYVGYSQQAIEKLGERSTTHITVWSRLGFEHTAQSSPSAMKKQRLQGRTPSCRSASAAARPAVLSAVAPMQWNVSRWAVLGPMPGRRPNSAASRSSTAAGISPIASDEARGQAQPRGELAHVLRGGLLGLVEGVVGGGEHHVGEQLGTLLEGLGFDAHRENLLVSVGRHRHRAAAGGPGDRSCRRARPAAWPSVSASAAAASSCCCSPVSPCDVWASLRSTAAGRPIGIVAKPGRRHPAAREGVEDSLGRLSGDAGAGYRWGVGPDERRRPARGDPATSPAASMRAATRLGSRSFSRWKL